MNKVQLVGRLTKDPELKFGTSGTAVARFSVAVNRPFSKEHEADFINCVAFGKTAENIQKFFTKGREIGIVGNIRTGSYDAKDGTKRYTTDVVVENFEFVGSKSSDSASSASAGSSETNTEISDGEIDFSGGDITAIDDGDMPF